MRLVSRLHLGYRWSPTIAGRPPEPVLPYFFFLAVFFLAAFFAFFFVAMVNSFRFWLGKQGLMPWVLRARTGMAHAYHRTATKTARGAMQGERKRGYKGERSRITRQPQVARLRCAACRTSQSIQVSLCPVVVRRCITLSAGYFVLVITDTALI